MIRMLLLLFSVVIAQADIGTEGYSVLNKEEYGRSEEGLRMLMHSILMDSWDYPNQSSGSITDYIPSPDNNSDFSKTFTIGRVKRDETKERKPGKKRNFLACSSQRYLNELNRFTLERSLTPPDTENLTPKQGLKKVRSFLRENNVTDYPSCKRQKPDLKQQIDYCKNKPAYFTSLVLYIFVHKGSVALPEEQIAKLREAFHQRDVESFYNLLHQLSSSLGLKPPVKCEFPPNCTISINLNQGLQFDDLVRMLQSAKVDGQELDSAEKIKELDEKFDSHFFKSSCAGGVKNRINPTIAMRPQIIQYYLRENEQFRKNYSLALASNKTNANLRQMYDSERNFYLFLIPNVYVGVFEKEKRKVPESFKKLVWEGTAQEYNSSMRGNQSIITDLIGDKAYFFTTLYDDPTKKMMNDAISILVIITLLCGMLSLGCTMTFNEILQHAKKPKGVIIALTSQFVIMPAAALGLSKLFKLDMYAAIAVLICGCCPGGNLSNVLAFALRGDMNLSILMTTCSSVLGLGMMPLNIFLYSKLIVPMDAGNVIPFTNIIINIAMTLVPVFIGLLIRHYREQWVNYIMKGGFCLMITAMVGTGFVAGILFEDAFFRFFPIELVGVCVLLPFAGYTLGYTFATVAREKPKCRRTIMVETGCQNVQLCTSVLRLAFDPVQINILFLMPLLYMAFQLLEAFGVIIALRAHTQFKSKGKVIDNKENSEDSDSFSKEFSDKENSRSDRKRFLPKPETYGGETNGRPVSEAVDIGEAWPLAGPPSDSCLNSFDIATTENLV